jgi:hypothetical protein
LILINVFLTGILAFGKSVAETVSEVKSAKPTINSLFMAIGFL